MTAGGEILAAILWFVFGDLLVVVTFWGVFALAALLAAAVDKVWVGVTGFIIAWLLGLGAVALVWWNVISHALAAGSIIWGW